MGLNNALTYCAKKIGIHPARMSWYADDGFILPSGPADDPAWWRTGDIRLGMAVWDVMTMIAGLVGYDLFVAPNGVWTTYPYSYDTGVAWAFDAGPAPADAWLSAREVEYEAETMLAATAVMATGEDASGLHTGAWLIDRQRESNTATNMFAGRRQWKRITGRRFLDTATAMGTATEEFDRQQETHYMLYWKSLPQLGAARGDAVTMAGAAMDGVPAGVDHLVESIIHTIGPYPIGSHTSFKAKRV